MPSGQASVSATALLTTATLPSVPLISIPPIAFGAGRLSVPPAPAASCTR